MISGFWPLVLILAMAMWYSQGIHLQVVYLVLGVAFTLMLMRFVVTEPRGAKPMDRGRAGALIRLLGLASYPTYLFHGPIVMLTGSLILRWNLVSDWRLTWMILTSVGIGSGILLGHFAERPIMAWRAGYLKRLRQSRPGTGAWRGGPASRRPAVSISQPEATTMIFATMLHQLRPLSPCPAAGPGEPATRAR